MRLFVAAWPSPSAAAALRGIDRPPLDGVRWSPEERWHVTLRFLGEVDDPAPVVAAVADAARALSPATATLGDAVERLGGIAAVPVAGVDGLAAAVTGATAQLGTPPEDRPFRGHVTVARGWGRRPVPAALAGLPVEPVAWVVDAVEVVRSHLGADHRYEVLATAPLTGTRRRR